MINADARGLNLHIFRFPLGDCTADGISSKAKGLILVGSSRAGGDVKPLPKTSQHREVSEDYPAVILDARSMGGERYGILVPAVIQDGEYVADPRWTQSGGNLASGDSRLNEVAQSLGLPRHAAAYSIHDRIENK
jgi:hypothetical protein